MPFKSDGCTFIKWVNSRDAEKYKLACLAHDFDYYIGGSAQDRKVADLRFRFNLIKAGMPEEQAVRWYWAVRIFGCSAWPGPPKWGGYTKEPPHRSGTT